MEGVLDDSQQQTASDAPCPTYNHAGTNRRSSSDWSAPREVTVVDPEATVLAKIAGGGKPGAPPVSGEGQGHEPQLQDDADDSSGSDAPFLAPITEELSKHGVVLKMYQRQAIQTGVDVLQRHGGLILADEMGLGKTLECASVVRAVQDKIPPTEACRVLTVVPLVTDDQWVTEYRKVGITATPYVAHRLKEGQAEGGTLEAVKLTELGPRSVIIVGFEAFNKDFMFFRKHRFEVVVVDEAHRAGGEKVTHDHLTTLGAAKTLLLTGTPFNNTPEEFVALVKLLKRPDVDADKLLSLFENVEDLEQLKALRGLLQEIVVRRLGRDFLHLPERTDEILLLEPSPLQEELLKTVPGIAPTYARQELQLLQHHPAVVPCLEKQVGVVPSEELGLWSPKFGEAMSLVNLHRGRGEKCIIVSRSVKTLNLLRAYMEKTSKGDIASIVVDGPHVEGRAADLERFREDPNIHCVFLSTKAGAHGLNLQSANVVILLDVDDNAHNQLQAIARSYRMGQEKHVHVYWLLMNNDLELTVFERGMGKVGKTLAVFDDLKGNRWDDGQLKMLLDFDGYSLVGKPRPKKPSKDTHTAAEGEGEGQEGEGEEGEEQRKARAAFLGSAISPSSAIKVTKRPPMANSNKLHEALDELRKRRTELGEAQDAPRAKRKAAVNSKTKAFAEPDARVDDETGDLKKRRRPRGPRQPPAQTQLQQQQQEQAAATLLHLAQQPPQTQQQQQQQQQQQAALVQQAQYAAMIQAQHQQQQQQHAMYTQMYMQQAAYQHMPQPLYPLLPTMGMAYPYHLMGQFAGQQQHYTLPAHYQTPTLPGSVYQAQPAQGPPAYYPTL